MLILLSTTEDKRDLEILRMLLPANVIKIHDGRMI